MAFENAVITDEGVKMLNNALEKTLILDHAAGGSGTVDHLFLMRQTSLTDQKQEFPIVRITEADQSGNGGKKLTLLITNQDLNTSYQLQQVGIYAHIEGEDDPRLFAILQDETGYSIPSVTEMSDFSMNFYLVVVVGNDVNIEVMTDTSALVSDAMLKDEMAGHDNSEAAHPNLAPTFEEASDRDNISSGESLSTLFGKIKKWLSDLKKVAFSGSYKDLGDTPSSLPNPQALTFSGGASGSYNGSQPLSVQIPQKLPNPQLLNFTGAASASYDGSSPVSIPIPFVPSSLPNPKSLKFSGQVSATYNGSQDVEIPLPTALPCPSSLLLRKNGSLISYTGSYTHPPIVLADITYGKVTITPVAGSVKTEHVKFGKTFFGEPSVIVQVDSGVPQNCSVGVSNVTTTGFDIHFYRSTAVNTGIFWTAIEFV